MKGFCSSSCFLLVCFSQHPRWDETQSRKKQSLQNADLQADNTWKIVAICWAVVTLPCVVFCATYVLKNKQNIIRRIQNRNPENLQPRGADPQAEKPCLSEETEVKGFPNSQLNQMSLCCSIRTERPEASSRHLETTTPGDALDTLATNTQPLVSLDTNGIHVPHQYDAGPVTSPENADPKAGTYVQNLLWQID